MFRNRAASLALVGLFVWLTGCTSYTQIGLGEIAAHGKVRVTLTGGERETIREPRVEADSIKGSEAAFAVTEVAKLEAVGTDEVTTVLAVFVGVAVVAYAVSCTVTDTSDDFIDVCPY